MVMVRNSLPVSDIKIYSTDTHPKLPPPHTYTILILSTPFIPLVLSNAPSLVSTSFSLCPPFLLLHSLLLNNSCPPRSFIYTSGKRNPGSGCVCTLGRCPSLIFWKNHNPCGKESPTRGGKTTQAPSASYYNSLCQGFLLIPCDEAWVLGWRIGEECEMMVWTSLGR